MAEMNRPNTIQYILNDDVDFLRNTVGFYNDHDYRENYDTYYLDIVNAINRIINNSAMINDAVGDNDIEAHVDIDPIYNNREEDDYGLPEPMDLDNDFEVDGEEPDIIPPLSTPVCPPMTPEQFLSHLGENCVICFRELQLIDITVTRCGHVYHASCLNTSLNYNTNCPTCRLQLM